jgi:hypothetical protein
VKLHTKKLKTPKMTRKQLKTLEFQNMKTKNLQTQEKKHIPHFLACEISHKFFEDTQNDNKKIEDFKMLKYQNKRPSKFPKEK